jgi:hypothetical protein
MKNVLFVLVCCAMLFACGGKTTVTPPVVPEPVVVVSDNPPDAELVPAGNGWYCVVGNDGVQTASFCYRDTDTCEIIKADIDSIPGVTSTPCEYYEACYGFTLTYVETEENWLGRGEFRASVDAETCNVLREIMEEGVVEAEESMGMKLVENMSDCVLLK